MNIRGPITGVEVECERVLRTLPLWFGREGALMEYAENTAKFQTFVAEENGQVIAFLSLQCNFPTSWEVNCIAVDAAYRNRGVGQALQSRTEEWLKGQGAKTLQVKTLSEAHPSPEYAQTRKFYECVGYIPVEVFPTLWGVGLPVLQLVKILHLGNGINTIPTDDPSPQTSVEVQSTVERLLPENLSDSNQPERNGD